MSEHESGSQEHPTNLNPDFAFGRDVPDRKVQPDFEAALNIKFDPSEDELRSWRDWVVEQDRQGGFRQVGQRGEYDSAVELVGPDPDIKVMQYVGDDSGVGLEIDQDAYEALKPYISANFLVPTAYIDTQDANPSRRYYALQNRQDGVSYDDAIAEGNRRVEDVPPEKIEQVLGAGDSEADRREVSYYGGVLEQMLPAEAWRKAQAHAGILQNQLKKLETTGVAMPHLSFVVTPEGAIRITGAMVRSLGDPTASSGWSGGSEIIEQVFNPTSERPNFHAK